MKKLGKCENRRDTMGAVKAAQGNFSSQIASPRLSCQTEDSHSELLILPDGQVLVHNLTPAFAKLLKELNPACEQITDRPRPLTHHATRVTPHEFPD